MKALVTGGAGYFGDLLCRMLHEKGWSVRIFDIQRPEETSPGAEVFQGDIRDAGAIKAACEGVDVIFHNVAQVPLAKDKDLFWSVNRDGTRNMLEAGQSAKVRKIVYTSSSAVFGIPKSNPVTEKTAPSPMEDYGRAKLAGEDICREFAKGGLDVSIVRPRTIMGHGRLGIFQILFEWIHQGANVPVLDGGKNIYQFVHADDLAEAIILAGTRPGPETYNCGAAKFGSMREVLENLCRVAGTGSKVRSLPMAPMVAAMEITSKIGLSPLGPYHSMMYGRSMYFDISKAQRELGWQPRYSNDEMFVDSYRWYLRNREATVNRAAATSSPHRSAVKAGALSLMRWIL
jgi:nucleoside-diphosphate-sugar epimerase